ncbi:MAG TPA: sigma-70 family RNA polymerase sigma factor [Cyclobacteriaceae bacterium]|nr:sigma-70 family RNA polymerase sigma factor [Cyclobacteriaceae bacterium]
MFFRQKQNSLTDQELIARFRTTEDLTLVSELFGRYTTMIYAVCVKYLSDRDDAKDAVMQLFEKLPGTLKTHEIANFKSWLYVTARNHCLMQIRARKGKKTEEIDSQVVENDFLLHQEEESELETDLTRLEKCVQQLADEQQKCVRLFFLEEKCYKDIAEITGFDLNKVKSHIQNGKRNLKICMEKREE